MDARVKMQSQLNEATAKRDSNSIQLSSHDSNYNTLLSPMEEEKFAKWKLDNAPKDSGADYDLRGAYKAGLQKDAKTEHWNDRFKKPNHPTFSDQSQYAKEAPEKAGSWNGNTYIPPKRRS